MLLIDKKAWNNGTALFEYFKRTYLKGNFLAGWNVQLFAFKQE